MVRTLVSGTSWQALAQVAPLIINLVLTPYTIHGLGLDVYTVFLLVNSIQAMMSTFNGGIGPSVQRYLTIYAGRDDREATTRLVTTMSVIVLGIVAVVLTAFFLLVPVIIGFFPVFAADASGSVFLLFTQIALIGLMQVRGLFQSVIFARQKFAFVSIAILVAHAIYTVGIIVTVETGAGLRGIAWIFIAQQVVGTVIIVPPAFRYLSRSGLGFIDRALLMEFGGYAWKVQISSWLDVLTQQADLLIVSKLRGAEAGIFGPGQTFAQQLRMLPMNAIGPMLVLVGRSVGEKGEKGAVADYERLQRLWTIAVTGWVATGAPAAYFGVVAWLHLGTDLPGRVASILLFGHLFALLMRAPILWCLALRRPGLDVTQGLVFLVLKIILTIGLAIPFGAIGVAVGTCVSQLGAALCLSWLVRTRLDTTVSSYWRQIPVGHALVCALISGVSTWGMSLLVGPVIPNGALGLLACGLAAGPALFIYLVSVLGVQTTKDLVKRRGRLA